ncbi:MAG TPA: ribosomal RNA small subunit methyltransferase A, partial [Candidatus Aminicenantes bacterium]|nr:ribosomal RNA small subunit methyltransferase A [Candidatus Aminicenantes bacterium]
APLHPVADEAGFRKFLGGAFAQRRKTLLNNFLAMGIPPDKGEAALASLGLAKTVRPEQVPIPAWISLVSLVR